MEGRVVPCTLQEVRAGQPVSPGRISQHGGLARAGVAAWVLQPFLHLLQPGLQPLGLWVRYGGDRGSARQQGGPGAVPTWAGHGLYLVLHQPVAGRALLAAGARRVGEEVGLAPVTLVAHEARAAEAGAVLVALRGDGAQRGAVAGCNGGRKVSRHGCQPRLWDLGAVPIPLPRQPRAEKPKKPWWHRSHCFPVTPSWQEHCPVSSWHLLSRDPVGWHSQLASRGGGG